MAHFLPADRTLIALLAVGGLILVMLVLLAIAFVVSEVIEARRRKAEVRRLQQRWADVLDVAADWVWETDAELRFTYISQRYFDATGFPPDQVLGRTRAEMRSPGQEDDAAWQAHLADMEARRTFRDFRYAFDDTEGRRRTIAVSGKPYFDEQGQFRGYRGTGTDLTETMEAEARAQESERRARQVIDGALDAFIAFDGEGAILDWNRRAVTMFGWSREAALGRRLDELIVPHAVRDDHQRMLRKLRGPRHERLLGRLLETSARSSNGGTFPIELTMTATETGAGRVYNAFMRDITERRQYEVALREAKEAAETASRAKSEFLAAMSHELRTPLNAVIGFADLFRQNPDMDREKRIDYAHDIHMSGVHLLELLNEVLDISKVEAGRMKLDEEAVDLTEICHTCLRLMGERASRAGVTLVKEVAEDLPPLVADPQRVKQIVINLLSNAVKFTDAGGTVTLRVRRSTGGGILLQVADSGIGMEPEQIARALEPFTQLDSGYARRHEGTGLGLALVNKFAEIHGATLLVESEPGVGTTVSITFPAERCVDDASDEEWQATPASHAASAT